VIGVKLRRTIDSVSEGATVAGSLFRARCRVPGAGGCGPCSEHGNLVTRPPRSRRSGARSVTRKRGGGRFAPARAA
jgi:hypothetical protein